MTCASKSLTHVPQKVSFDTTLSRRISARRGNPLHGILPKMPQYWAFIIWHQTYNQKGVHEIHDACLIHHQEGKCVHPLDLLVDCGDDICVEGGPIFLSYSYFDIGPDLPQPAYRQVRQAGWRGSDPPSCETLTKFISRGGSAKQFAH